ncbi:hypothetical protein [Novosphingobium aquae]|uniref:Uncharacterized protein n=1 Tax=Novosphingobium aquae TaxID=3133435 RepID=A0ABU8S8V7_9SPHN
MRIERDSETGSHQVLKALAAGVAVAALAIVAHVGRIAESSVAGAVPALGAFGPGKMGQLRAMQLDQTGAVPAGAAELGREALAKAPLAYEPFMAVAASGFREKAAIGTAADAKLLTEALRRNPRSREARYFLMRHALGSGDLNGAVGHIAVLNRLTNGVTDQLMPGLGAAIRSEKQVDEAVTALAPHPELLEPFLKGFSAKAKPAALSTRLVQRLPRSSFANPAVRRQAIRLLISAQAFTQARGLWGAGAASSGLIHSPDFSDTKAPPPFNWDLRADATGAAERDPAGGLAIDYFGRTPGPLVSQLLTLAPGTYKARLDYRTTGGTPGALGVQMTCAGKDLRVFDQPLTGAAGVSQALVVTFTVPQGCPGQQLAIAGRMQESRDSQQALVQKLDVTTGAAK